MPNDLKSSTVFQEGTQSIHRTISLLRTVAEANDQGMRLYQIAKKAGLPNTTTHRILSVLVSEDFLDYDPFSKCYYIGIELHSLGTKAKRFAMKEKYRLCLENIAHKTHDSVYLVLRSGFDALCIDSIEGESSIRIMTYNVGSRRPLGIGAGSLALLAFSSDNDIEAVLNANRLRYKRHGDITVNKVKTMIKNTRKFGFVFNEGTYMKGINGVGVPLYDNKGEITAAISVASISERINFARAKKITKLIKSEISLIR